MTTGTQYWTQVEPGWTPPEPVACVTVTLGGIEMHGNAQRGAFYGLTDWDGWTSGAGSRGGPTPHENADGGVMGPVLMSGRTIRLEGKIEGRTTDRLAMMSEDLAAVLTRPREDWLIVDEELLGLSRQVRVTRSGPPRITVASSRRQAIFTLELQAADWRRVSVAQSTLVKSVGQSGALVNVGNADADLAAVLTGPLTNPRITVTGQGYWEYVGTIAAGQTVGVDFANRLVRDTANGVLLRRSARGSWPQVAPGTSTATITGTGSGTFDLRWRSSWS